MPCSRRRSTIMNHTGPLSTRPKDVPKCAKARLGFVGPGTEANQLSHEVILGKRADGRQSLRAEALHDVSRVATGSRIACGESPHVPLRLMRLCFPRCYPIHQAT